MANWVWRHRTIGIDSAEPLLVDKILWIYFVIGGVEPLVVHEIMLRCIGIDGIEPLLFGYIQSFWEDKVRVFREKCLSLRYILPETG